MPDFIQLINEDQRLCIVRTLDEMPSMSANCSILQQGLEIYAHHISRDKVHTHLNWLEENGIVSLKQVHSSKITTLTQRGIDIAKGRVSQPGIKRPAPKA